ncbi:hypothetical protein B0H19DRAFT_1337977 [Mycena capillaripes]|nr:hypothetical protein B0H19DRAFT_1337977 [Mycena capillaripes]
MPQETSPCFIKKFSLSRLSIFNLRGPVQRQVHGWKPFLEVTPEEVQESQSIPSCLSLNTNIVAAFSFSREAILKFKENTIEAENPNRGTLIFASTRGNAMTSGFAIGKFGARGLSQSLVE